MTEQMTVVQAMAEVMGDVREVKKTQQNQHQRYNFRGIDAVLNAVGPALRKHGVVIVPSKIMAHEITTAVTTGGKTTNAVRVHVEYTILGPSGDSLKTEIVGEAADSADKGSAKALSVAYRTLLLQAFTLPTDDTDPDSEDAVPYSREAAPAQAPIPQIVQKGRDSLNNRIAAMPDEERKMLQAAWVEARLPKLAQATTTKHLEVIKELIDRVHADYTAATSGEPTDQPMALDNP